MRTSLEVGKFYTLSYKDPWIDFDARDIRVKAITTDKETASFGVDSLFSEFFAKYNIGIGSYVSYMNSTPEVYVCEYITTRDPYEPEDTLVLVPKVIIDFNKVEELIQCDDIVVSVSGLHVNNALIYERGNNLINLTNNVREALKTIPEYGDTPIDVVYETFTILKSKSTHDSYIAFKEQSHILQKTAELEVQRKHNEDLRTLISKASELDTLITENKLKKATLDSNIATYSNLINIYNTLVDNIKSSNIELFVGLEDGTIEVGDSTFRALKKVIIESLGQ